MFVLCVVCCTGLADTGFMTFFFFFFFVILLLGSSCFLGVTTFRSSDGQDRQMDAGLCMLGWIHMSWIHVVTSSLLSYVPN